MLLTEYLAGRKDDRTVREREGGSSQEAGRLVYSDLVPGMDEGFASAWGGSLPSPGWGERKEEGPNLLTRWHPVQPEARHLAFQVAVSLKTRGRGKSIRSHVKETSDHRKQQHYWGYEPGTTRDPVRTGDGEGFRHTRMTQPQSNGPAATTGNQLLCRSLPPFGLAHL